uniref:uncharacterized protein LOC120888142 n=1 Tax=Ictidomys tridecemlineatus TaxID=43179 RepID=UPI001A9F9E20|nr:uncharacterized protein LOC120888142 [Ictidomys tridecemlineatus]
MEDARRIRFQISNGWFLVSVCALPHGNTQQRQRLFRTEVLITAHRVHRGGVRAKPELVCRDLPGTSEGRCACLWREQPALPQPSVTETSPVARSTDRGGFLLPSDLGTTTHPSTRLLLLEVKSPAHLLPLVEPGTHRARYWARRSRGGTGLCVPHTWYHRSGTVGLVFPNTPPGEHPQPCARAGLRLSPGADPGALRRPSWMCRAARRAVPLAGEREGWVCGARSNPSPREALSQHHGGHGTITLTPPCSWARRLPGGLDTGWQDSGLTGAQCRGCREAPGSTAEPGPQGRFAPRQVSRDRHLPDPTPSQKVPRHRAAPGI